MLNHAWKTSQGASHQFSRPACVCMHKRITEAGDECTDRVIGWIREEQNALTMLLLSEECKGRAKSKHHIHPGRKQCHAPDIPPAATKLDSTGSKNRSIDRKI